MKIIFDKIQSNGMQSVRLMGKVGDNDIRWLINSYPNSDHMKECLRMIYKRYVIEEVIDLNDNNQ